MDKDKWVKALMATLTVVVPFGIVAAGGYYGYQFYKKKREQKVLGEARPIVQEEEIKK
jgi:uncharacterized membrane protein YebE (DUF533 family)